MKLLIGLLTLLLLLTMLAGCGNQEAAGQQGPPGVAGPQGPTGPQGPQGAPGADGESIVANMVPASWLACPTGGVVLSTAVDANRDGVLDTGDSGLQSTTICNGAQGIQGLQGVAGQTGATGATGSQGSAGTPGTVITPVQFCPGTPIYPSDFLEVGLCIDGKLYAVYSANDGFLTFLPDGAYQSNAIGSSCNFTVSGCTIN